MKQGREEHIKLRQRGGERQSKEAATLSPTEALYRGGKFSADSARTPRKGRNQEMASALVPKDPTEVSASVPKP